MYHSKKHVICCKIDKCQFINKCEKYKPKSSGHSVNTSNIIPFTLNKPTEQN